MASKKIQNSNTGLPSPKFDVLPAYISQLFSNISAVLP